MTNQTEPKSLTQEQIADLAVDFCALIAIVETTQCTEEVEQRCTKLAEKLYVESGAAEFSFDQVLEHLEKKYANL